MKTLMRPVEGNTWMKGKMVSNLCQESFQGTELCFTYASRQSSNINKVERSTGQDFGWTENIWSKEKNFGFQHTLSITSVPH